ncbi:UNVERIFIED_CONTAM: hypothetical protein GTU68_049909 [Idotea baltica]|nr:hypothetical protein [Idotea baltica]
MSLRQWRGFRRLLRAFPCGSRYPEDGRDADALALRGLCPGEYPLSERNPVAEAPGAFRRGGHRPVGGGEPLDRLACSGNRQGWPGGSRGNGTVRGALSFGRQPGHPPGEEPVPQEVRALVLRRSAGGMTRVRRSARRS